MTMPGIKEVIEQFYERFKNVRFRLSFPSYGHDLLDVDAGTPRLHEENADINTILGEYIGLPWYPGRQFYPQGEGTEAEDAADCERQKEVIFAGFAEFDRYYTEKQEVEAAVPQMGENDARQHRLAFNRSAREKYPLAHRLDVFNLSLVMERFPSARDEKGLKSVISSCGEWGDSPGPCYIETIPENTTRHREEKREELDEVARRLADKMGCPVGSMAFIAGCHRLLRMHRDRRRGLREDGLCATAYPGTLAGYEQWCEMDQDIQGDISQIHQIIGWLKQHCPLLWCLYQERRLRRKKGGRK